MTGKCWLWKRFQKIEFTSAQTVLTGAEALLTDAFDAAAAAAGADRHRRSINATSVWELKASSIPKASLRI